MGTATIIILTGIALSALGSLLVSLAVIACVVKSAKMNQRIVEHDSLKPGCIVVLSACDLENREDSLELAAQA